MDNEKEKITIPEQYQQLCKDIGSVLRKFETENYNVDINDGIHSFVGK